MSTDPDDLVIRHALRSGFGLPAERLARMAAARSVGAVAWDFGDFRTHSYTDARSPSTHENGTLPTFADSGFVVTENITL